jgi:hypothetical protein
MPFKSEAQRKYLWANEPEIARDWTDTYGSGIQAAQGGRIGLRRGSGPGPGGQGARGQATQNPGRSAPSGPGPDRHPPAQTPAHTVAPTAQYDDRIQRIAAQNQRTAALRDTASDQGFHQFLTPRTNYQKPTFGMRLRSGLGALGRGIGHVARNFNPLSLAFDNPYMKLLMSGYGRGNTRNLFQRNNQDDEEIDYNQLGLYTDRIGDAIGPGKRVGEDINVQETILPEDRPTDSLMDDRTLMAKNVGPALIQMRNFERKSKAPEIYGALTPEEEKMYEKSLERDKEEKIYKMPVLTAVGAEGGLIGSVGGTSRQKYQGGNMVGAEMEGAEMEGAEMQSQEVIKELYDAFIAQGLSPQEAIEKIKQMIASSGAQEPESPMMGEEFPGQEFGRAPAAFGGIMDTYTGRRKYGFGSFIKKAFKKIKKIAKSPIGKAALVAGLGYFAPTMLGGLGKGASMAQRGGWWKGVPKYLLGSVGANPRAASMPSFLGDTGFKTASGILGKGGPMGKFALTQGGGSMMPSALGWGAAATAAPLIMGATGNWEQDQLPGMPGGDQAFDFDLGQARKDIASAVAGGDYNEFKNVLNKYDMTEGNQIGFWDTLAHGAEGGRAMAQGGRIGYQGGSGFNLKNLDPSSLQHLKQVFTQTNANPKGLSFNKWALQNYEWALGLAHGGRIGRQEGGLMNLGGMEKDYRNDGGFVPLGGEEKADDVPARLSKNEFVFTADAVRNAGGGDIDAGAEVMENVMKNLEGGGQISEESQGQGAQEMFETSERLSEVI